MLHKTSLVSLLVLVDGRHRRKRIRCFPLGKAEGLWVGGKVCSCLCCD